MNWSNPRKVVRVLLAAALLASGIAVTSGAPSAASAAPHSASLEVRLMNGSAPTVEAPVTLTADGVTVHYPVIVTGFTAASLSATISVPSGSGTFSFATTSGITAMFGYPSVSAVPTANYEIGFFGDNAAVTSILANHLRWTGGNTGDVTVSVAVNAFEEGFIYNPVNGHFYEFVSGPVSWLDASNSAVTKIHASTGTQGYLATITSASENDFIASKVSAPSIWIGATDDFSYINAVTASAFADQNASEGKWHWATGPEAGMQFWEGAANGVTVSGSFAAWGNAVYGGVNVEPNSSGNCGLTNWGSPLGRWDDQSCANTKSYLVEYGPLLSPVQAVAVSVAAEVVDPVTLTVQVSGAGTVSSLPAGIDCGSTCSALFAPGVVTLSAVAGSGQRLESWGSGCAGTGACTLTMTGDQTVSATFGPVPVFVETPTTTTVAPPASTNPVPVTDPETGALPTLAPGETSVFENGVAVSVELVAEGGTDLVLRGAGFELRLSGECSSGCSVQTDGSGRQILQLDSEGAARVSGEGFQAGSSVYVWLFSSPVFLGELTVGAGGTFSGSLPLTGVEPGEHTLQVSGVSTDGQVRTANLGVVVASSSLVPDLGTLPATGQSLDAVKWMLLMLGLGGVLLIARRRVLS
jgi:hypothetical protein